MEVVAVVVQARGRRGSGRAGRAASGALAALSISIGVIALLVALYLLKFPPAPPAPPGETRIQLDVAETRRLESLKSEAIALLESVKLEEAEAKFAQIAERLPRDEVVLQNVAVGRLIPLTSDKSDVAMTTAQAAVERLLAAHPDSAVGHYLAAERLGAELAVASFEAQERGLVEQLRYLRRAAELDPTSVVYPYGVWDASRNSTDPAITSAAEAALLAALELDPDNLYVLGEAIEVLAKREDSRFLEATERLERLLGPLLGGLRRRVRNSDPAAVLSSAREAAAAGKWKEAGRKLFELRWVKSDDVAQSDRRRVKPHPLEYVVREFTTAEPAELPVAALEPVRLPLQPTPLGLDGAGEPLDVLWGDADLDERLDVWTIARAKPAAESGSESSPTSLIVMSRAASGADGAGSTWTQIARLELPVVAERLLLADLDRDDKRVTKFRAGVESVSGKRESAEADLDAVAFGPGGVRIVRNSADPESGVRTLEIVPQEAGLDDLRGVTAATLGDFDHDGDLDLALACGGSLQLWINRGAAVFDNVTTWSTPPEAGVEFTGLAAVDWDRDVDIDVIAVGPAAGRIGILENLRHLNFRWRDRSDAVEGLASGRAVRVLEVDGNASWDLAIGAGDGLHVVRTDTPDAGVVQWRAARQAAEGAANRLTTADLDNDGRPDVVAVGDGRLQLLRGEPDGRFVKFETDEATESLRGSAVDAGDMDGDGDLDLIVASSAGLTFVENRLPAGRVWLDVEVRGIEEAISGRVNHLAIGSVVELRTASGRYQAQVVQSATTHFGLGDDERAEVARVLFTNGVPQSIVGPASKQTIRETQKQIGSCPYLYCWDGERTVFYTDLLWAAPLGLRTVAGEVVPDRSWEFLKIDGRRLAPRDGRYELQVTEELWEAGYFDQVELLAVDHPEEVEVYSNEKVGPPDLAAFKIHTVRRRRTPLAAHDSAGRDVLAELRTRDERYATCFEKTHRQGLTEPHHLELDLGPQPDGARIMLYLSGWIRPTDSSLNVALAQDPRFGDPAPPSVWVPDSNGGWRETMPFMGFPGGKTKTIAVDLTGKLASGDGRLQIRTSCELRWDEAFFTVDDEPAELRTTQLELVSADLHYAGYSRRVVSTTGGPDLFDHEVKNLEPEWPPMRGAFTRYGDVLELLTEVDDRLAIIGPGDEITVRFQAPPPPPAGWKRDFILHNVGWDKDCVLNTGLGQTVEPLPFQAMKSYPYEPSTYPDSPEMRDYLRTYQTRRQSFPEFWKRLAAPTDR